MLVKVAVKRVGVRKEKKKPEWHWNKGQCCTVYPAAVTRRERRRSHEEDKYSFLLNIIFFPIYIISVATSWWKPQIPVTRRSGSLYTSCSSKPAGKRNHGLMANVGSDLFSSRGMAEQCKEGLNHPRGASLSRGFVSPMPAIGCSADLGVTAWKTLLSRSSCRSERKQIYLGKYIQANKC